MTKTLSRSDTVLQSQPPLCIVSGSLPLGGSTTFVLNLAKGMSAEQGPLPVICMEHECPMASEFTSAGVQLHRMDRAGKIFEDTIRDTYSQLAKIRPRAVLANLSSDSFEILRLTPPGILRLGIIHSDDPGPYQMAKQFTPWLDGIIGVSEKICQNLREMPEFSGVTIHHIPYGIPFDESDPSIRPNKTPPLKVIYLGRLIEEQKRISRVAKVIQICASESLPIHFTIAGSGPQEEWLKSEITDLKNVSILGHLPNSQVAEHLRNNDIYLLLSDYEGLPLSLLESMGEGLVPVVPTMDSGISEVVTPENGICLRVTTPECAVSALKHLVQNPDRLALLSKNAKLSVRTLYTANNMVSKVLALCELENPVASWIERPSISRPIGLSSSFLYSAPLRMVRRTLKKVLS